MTLGENIKIKRKEKRLTQEKLAEIIGVHPNTIRQWEKNKNSPKTQDIEKLAEALDTTISYLYGETSVFGTTYIRTFYTEDIDGSVTSEWTVISELPDNFFKFWGDVLDETKRAIKRNDSDEMKLIVQNYLNPAYRMIINAQKQARQFGKIEKNQKKT